MASYKILTARRIGGLTMAMNSMENIIRAKLAQALQPSVLTIDNQSGRHKGHAGDNGTGESHFHVEVVSDSFSGLSRIARQRMVYDLLREELQGTLHALSLRLLTPAEYKK